MAATRTQPGTNAIFILSDSLFLAHVFAKVYHGQTFVTRRLRRFEYSRSDVRKVKSPACFGASHADLVGNYDASAEWPHGSGRCLLSREQPRRLGRPSKDATSTFACCSVASSQGNPMCASQTPCLNKPVARIRVTGLPVVSTSLTSQLTQEHPPPSWKDGVGRIVNFPGPCRFSHVACLHHFGAKYPQRRAANPAGRPNRGAQI